MVASNVKAFGYVRVSTEGQVEEGVSLAAQREKIAAYCSLHGLELVAVEGDEGLSGRRADNRPALQRALTAACKAKGVLVVYSLSRLARSTRDCIDIAERLKRSGAGLASITEKLDTASAMGEFFFTLMAALGQLERGQVSERTRGVMGHLRRQGRRISGIVPYGYDADGGGGLVENPAELAVVERIASMRRDGGLSFQAIANSLNDGGVRPKAGGQWYGSAVRSVMLTAGRRRGN